MCQVDATPPVTLHAGAGSDAGSQLESQAWGTLFLGNAAGTDDESPVAGFYWCLGLATSSPYVCDVLGWRSAPANVSRVEFATAQFGATVDLTAGESYVVGVYVCNVVRLCSGTVWGLPTQVGLTNRAAQPGRLCRSPNHRDDVVAALHQLLGDVAT